MVYLQCQPAALAPAAAKAAEGGSTTGSATAGTGAQGSTHHQHYYHHRHHSPPAVPPPTPAVLFVSRVEWSTLLAVLNSMDRKLPVERRDNSPEKRSAPPRTNKGECGRIICQLGGKPSAL